KVEKIRRKLLRFAKKTPNQVDAEWELVGKTIKVWLPERELVVFKLLTDCLFPADVYLSALKMQSEVAYAT
ncbi:hypothetical protein MKX03_018031, partial [Papaver bracteatum]